MILNPDKIITGDGKTVLENYAVRIEGDRIAQIAPLDALCRMFPEEAVETYKGCSLLPGLCDMHTHIGYFPGCVEKQQQTETMLAFCAMAKAQRALRKGTTLIRDVASPENICRAITCAAQNGMLVAPHIISAGAGMCITGGHFYHAYPGVEEVDGCEALIRAVRKRLKDGYTWIKLMTTDRSEVCEYSREELCAVTEEAHRLGGKVAVHASNRLGIQMCLDAGVDSIEHASEMTEEQADQMVEKGIAWTPTVFVYRCALEREQHNQGAPSGNLARYQRACEGYQNNFLRYYQKGIHVVAGTDLNDLPIADELCCLVELGLTPLQAIRIGTANGAKLAGMEHQTGQIQEGLLADILIVHGDAQKDIGALKNPAAVLFGGKFVG